MAAMHVAHKAEGATARKDGQGVRRAAWLVLAAMLLSIVGCGGTSQSDLRVLRRPSDDDSETAPTDAAKAAAADRVKATGNRPPRAPVAKRVKSPVDGAQASTRRASSAQRAAPAAQSVPPSKASSTAQDAVASDLASLPAAQPLSDRPEPTTIAQRRQWTLDNLGKIGYAIQAYVEYEGTYPANAIYDVAQQPLLSWRVRLLPYLGYEKLYKRFDLSAPWDSDHNRPLLSEIPAEYQSPERRDVRTNYLLPIGPSTLFQGPRGISPRKIDDGPANTVMLLEVDDSAAVPWTKPDDYVPQPLAVGQSLGSLRGGEIFLIWASGRVGAIDVDAPAPKLRAMLTIDGGEPLVQAELHHDPTADPPAAEDASQVNGASQVTTAAGAAKDTPPRRTDGHAPGANGSKQPLNVSELPPEEMTPDELAEGARRAAALGQEREAMPMYYASLVSRQSDAPLLADMHWSPALKRPAIVLRWGLGVHYIGPRSAKGLNVPKAETSIAGRIKAVDGSAQLKGFTGEMGVELAQLLVRQVEAGCCGGLLEEAAAGAVARRRRGGRRVHFEDAVQTAPLGIGVTYLGEGSRQGLLHVAALEGIDVLVLLDVTAKPTRGGTSITVSTSLLDADKGHTLLEAATLNNLRTQQVLQSPTAEDPLSQMLDGVERFVRTDLQLEDLPELKPEHVAGRVAELVESTPANPLPVLAELRFYRARGLIEEPTWRTACRALVGDEAGKQLGAANPSQEQEQQRVRALARWLPQVEREVKRGR